MIFARYEARQRTTRDRQEQEAAISERLDQILGKLLRIKVEQKYHLSEALLGFERSNRYHVTPLPSQPGIGDWNIEEQNVSGFSILGRNLFGLLYTFTMHITDGSGNVIVRLHRRPRLYFHELEIFDENGAECGLAWRRFSFFNRTLSVSGSQGRNALRIVGPIWSPWTLHVYAGNRKVAQVTKKWSGLLKGAYTDSDTFDLEFINTTQTHHKKLAIAALMMIDSLYFEGRKSFFNHFVSAPGIQIIAAGAALAWFLPQV